MDNGAGKGKLTCALFDRCSGPKRATNYAGQGEWWKKQTRLGPSEDIVNNRQAWISDPCFNHSFPDDPTYIVNSYGYCKSGNCDADAVEADAEDDE